MKDIIEKHFKENADRVINKDGELRVVRGKATVYANKRLKSWQDAEDCVQEAYTRALSYSDGFKEGSDFDCWFFIILANVVNNHLYQKDNSPELVSTDEENLLEEDEPLYTPKEEGFVSSIQSLLCKKTERAILILYYVYGHKAVHISDMLQIPPSRVREVLSRYSNLNG